MKISEEFPSKYLRASDLDNREVRLTMSNVEIEKLGEDNKPVLYFKGKDRGLVLNKTNANTISDDYGDDTEDWYDQPLILFSVMVDFQGKVGPAIRVRVPTAKDNKAAAPKKSDPISSGPERIARDEPPAHTDDDIPF
jgi:hypothetical protein